MTEVTMAGGLVVTAVVVILMTTILVIITKAFPSNRSRDSSDGGGVAVPVIPDTSSIVTPSLSSPPGCWKYDVFLSFRGEDTRKTFVDHLYSALQQHGIILTYKDDKTLNRGDTIAPALVKAIETSQIALVIFSKNYANSSWCLDELSHIMNCRDRETGQIVFPIFYHVDPSDVRKQKGKFGKAFAKHNNKKKVESWRKALVDASNIAGWEPNQVANGHEAKCIREIVNSILVKLPSLESGDEDEELIGMRTRLKYLKRILKIGSGGVRMVGIWGVGGGGKTTLATSIYKELKISSQFHGCCFIENIRQESNQQNGLKNLQEKILSSVFDKKTKVESVGIGKHTIKDMLCRRNVLIVLDDVDDLEQLEALVGRHNWFGNGSRIIITTRDEQVLISHRVDEVYPVSLLSHDEAIRLFRRHAYKEHNPVEDYEKLSLRVLSYVNGLPLALKILGSFLYGKDKNEWESALDKLKRIPNSKVTVQLKISYDGLDNDEKEIFLDIACFFRGHYKDDAMKILDACGFYPDTGIKVLIQKALISVSKYSKFDMHDLVQEMAHYIVRGKHPNDPGKRSRIWRMEDIEDMCSMNATTENDKIEAISCHGSIPSNFRMLVSNMKKLRFLDVSERITISYNEGPSFLSNELRYMRWNCYPGSPFPKSFEPKKLPVLRMQGSLQKVLWEDYKYLPCLKELELLHMKALVRTPDFGGLPCLRKLKLYNCSSLEEIHESLGNHSSLVYVEVRECKKLRMFPRIVGMEKLEILRISKCKALVEFPLRIEGKMDKLVELYLDDVGIEVLSVGEYCTNLTSLKLSYCSKLKSIEGNFPRFLRELNLPCLKELELRWMRELVTTPDFGGLPCLQKLTLARCESLEEIHESLGNHSSLVSVEVSFCEKLTRFPRIVGMGKLEILRISDCPALVEFPLRIEGKMDKLVELYCTNLISIKLKDCSYLKSIEGNIPRFLRKLTLNGCGLKDGEIPIEIGELFSLQELCLRTNDFTRLDFSLSRLTRLKLLQLSYCKKLVELPELPSSLAILHADGCRSLEGVMRDEIHTNCKRLSQVSITRGGKNIKGVERLLETMLLQGNDGVERRCMILQVDGLEIARGFEGGLVKGSIYGLVKRRRCGMQLPENWSNDFSGFLICAATSENEEDLKIIMKHEEDISVDDMEITMKHEEDVIVDDTDESVDEKDDDDDDSKEEDVSVDDDDGDSTHEILDEYYGSGNWHTWVGYISFSLLRDTLWWDPKSTAVHIQMDRCIIGLKLVPKRGDGGEETSAQMETTTHPSFSSQISLDDDDDHPYNCQFHIHHDSKSGLKCRIERNYLHHYNLWW